MSLVDDIYGWLATEPGSDVDETFAAALEHAESPYAARITSVLLQRATEPAWAGLLANYDRLPPESQEQLHARPDLIRHGAAYALRSATSRGRLNTLRMLAEHACPEVAPAVAGALRDSALRVREAAASVLRETAEHMLSEFPTAQARAPATAPELSAQRAAVVQALREALRTFEVHLHVELLEACLWYAKDLASSLWDALDAHRSRSAHAVEQQLHAWNDPRLAGFLLLALGHQRWSRAAYSLLRSWSTRTQLLAILDQSDLLANPGVACHFRVLKRPRWLAAADPALSDLPRAARAQVPFWICHLGFTDEERECLLRRWQASTFPELRRAAVYAAGTLRTPGATRVLEDAGTGSDALSRFARWCVAGRPAAVQDTVPNPPPPAARRPGAREAHV